MDAYAGEWLQLLLRWIHFVTGIAWIGSSFYFVWLDNSLLAPRDPGDEARGVGGELWAVHGGGFYQVRKYRIAPTVLPETLHWFQWEAYSTWLSGFTLLVVMYYLHAEVYLIDRSVADLSVVQAVGISFGLLVAGWVFYDQLCRRLGLDRERILAVVMLVFIAAVAWGLSQVFPGRALFMQVGAMLGTMMAGNVLWVIIPGQRRLVEAKQAGVAPDPVHGRRGKQRSVHNNYYTLPVLFVMISNHYPLTWAHPQAWLVLLVILLLAAYVRHFFNLRHRGRTVWAIPFTAALATLGLAFAIAPQRPIADEVPEYSAVAAIIASRCASCHAERPTQPGIAIAPKGVLLDTPERIRAAAPKILEQAVSTRAMPIGNLTGMSDAERARLGAWIAGGAQLR